MNQQSLSQSHISPDPSEGLDSISSRRGKVMAWMVMGVIVLPMVAAYLIFKTGFGIPLGTVNKGELIVPATSLEQLSIVDSEQLPVNWLQTPKADFKWRLLIIGDGSCDETCQAQLYKARQVHKRLAEKSRRVERIYLSTSSQLSSELSSLIETEYSRMSVGWVDPTAVQSLFSATSLTDTTGRILVVDQQGYAMMSYDNSHAGGEMLDDIKRLLKYSYDG